MDAVLILVGHGSPPKGYDSRKISRYIELERRAESGDPYALRDFKELDREIRNIPRSRDNDPYWYFINQIAEEIKRRGVFRDVYIAFNEFCSPDVDEAIENAINRYPNSKVIVVPTMIIRGGSHSEKDIPDKIKKVKRRYPESDIIYAWPFPVEEVSKLFIEQALRFK